MLTEKARCYLYGLLEGLSGDLMPSDKPASEGADVWFVGLSNGISRSTIFNEHPYKVIDQFRESLGPDEYSGKPCNRVPQRKLRMILEKARRDLRPEHKGALDDGGDSDNEDSFEDLL